MPKYEYECESCKNTFEVFMSLKDKADTKVTCPKCKSDDISQIFSGVNIFKKSIAQKGSSGCCGGSDCCN